jgi:hypothetical protein
VIRPVAPDFDLALPRVEDRRVVDGEVTPGGVPRRGPGTGDESGRARDVQSGQSGLRRRRVLILQAIDASGMRVSLTVVADDEIRLGVFRSTAPRRRVGRA